MHIIETVYILNEVAHVRALKRLLSQITPCIPLSDRVHVIMEETEEMSGETQAPRLVMHLCKK